MLLYSLSNKYISILWYILYHGRKFEVYVGNQSQVASMR